MPELKAVLRCSVHSSIKSLEKALSTDSRVDELIQSWILAYSTSKTAKGGFVRATRNSPKLQGQLLEAMQTLDATCTKLGHSNIPGC